ncbi:MAG: hypothetical protein PHG67_07395 [Bacteroidales bacterium]|nr:hypothetical protein [Bacteroidales bacterium]HOI31966.1 hypothetical protein [Bacteroidales bacterium]
MRIITKILLSSIFLMILSFSSCKKDDEISPMSCNLKTSSTEFTEESINVTYKLEVDGDYTVTSFFYYDETGKVEMQNPEVPQNFTVTLSSQKKMEAGAVGNVTNGFIKVSFEAIAPGSEYKSSDLCSQSSN